MQVTRWTIIGATAGLAACAAAATTNVRPPLGAHLSPAAKTGTQVPLRFDPNAKVIPSSAAGLPPASYFPAQAARGADLFNNTCGACHENSEMIGQRFVESWGDRRVYDLYALIRSTMPLDKPGSMKDQEYLDVVAYLLQANRAPPGADSLKVDTLTLRKTRIAVKLP